MIRQLKRRLQRQGEQLLVALVLPAFFLSTLPQMACICADGHREASCPALKVHCASPQGATPRGAKSCCRRSESELGRSCCHGKGCPPASSNQSPLSRIGTKSGVCCHPVVEAPAPAVTPKKTGPTEPSSLVAVSQPPAALISAPELWPALVPVAQSTPPPLDAVIVFSRLTI